MRHRIIKGIRPLISGILLLVSILLAGCEKENTSVELTADEELTIKGISDTYWTYISLERNEVVGTSAFDSPEEDMKWRNRLDWDIAICGDKLRTNSGESGDGNGGLTYLEDLRYEDITSSTPLQFEVDN